MRKTFSELEFQFALMAGYYTLFSKQDSLNLYIPTGKEEHDEYAADWFYENAQGVSLYLQFKKSKAATRNRNIARNEYARNERTRRQFHSNLNEVYEFDVYKKNGLYQQHNLLLSKNTDNSMGLYVAPIFTSRFELHHKLKSWLAEENYSSEIIYQLFYEQISRPVRLNQGRDAFSFFKDVIYIKPHQEITDANPHHYCYNKKRAVSFHSDFVPLKDEGHDISNIFYRIDSKLKKGKTKTILEATDDNFKDLEKYFEENDLQIVRDYRIEQILGATPKGSENIFSQLKGYKNNKKYAKYVNSVNQLYQEVFDIQWSFIYPRF